MAVLAKINFRNNATAVGDFTSISDHLTIGQVGTVNGIGIHNQVSFQGNAFSSTNTPASDPLYTEWPRGVLERYWIADAGGGQIRYSGFTPNTQYTFYYMCPASADNLDMEITDGTNTVTYDVPADPTTTLTGPVALVSTSDANGDIVHSYSCAVSGQANLCALIIDDAAPSASPEVTADASTFPGDTINHTATNFGGAITTATLGDGTSSVSLSSVTATSAVMPAMGNDVAYTTFGAGKVYTLSDGTDSASDSVDLDPPAGYNLVTLSASPNTGATSWLYNYGNPAAAGDQGVYDPIASDTGATLTLNADGSWSSTASGTWPDIFVIDASDGFMEQITLTAVGIIDSPASVTPGASYSITLDLEVTISSVTVDGVTQTIGSQTSSAGETVVNLTAVQGGAKFANTLSLVANIQGGGMADADINLVPATGNSYVNITSISQQDNSIFLSGRLPTGEVGDQVEWDDAGNTTIAADGGITQTVQGDFNARLWDASTSTWGSWTLIEISSPRIVSVSPSVLEPNESFTVTLELIDANDVRSLTISDGTNSWTIGVDLVINDTSFTATAPSDLPLGQTLTFELNESKDARQLRSLLDSKAPLTLPTYTVATVPSAADSIRQLIYVSDEIGGATIAFSDGTNWRRLQDLAVIS